MSKTILLTGISDVLLMLVTFQRKYFSHMGFELIIYKDEELYKPVDFVLEVNFQWSGKYFGLKNKDNILRIYNTDFQMHHSSVQTETNYIVNDSDWTTYEPLFDDIYNRLWNDDIN